LILAFAFVAPFLVKSLFANVDEVVVNSPCYIALIIDDFGNKSHGTQEFLDLEIKYTAAVMPGLLFTKDDCEKLISKNKEIILHMPMEPHYGKKSWLGEKALTSDLSDEKIKKNIIESLKDIRYAIGMNNHMGSKIMENKHVLDIVFKVANENKLIFVDSVTTSKSKAREIAEKYNVKFFKRDIFIDANSVYQVEKNLKKAIKTALSKKYCIAIGHVGPAGGKTTAIAIKNICEKFKNTPLRFITITELAELF
jgi:polysaccharide deacetylase 2 family uncharacterized protein YibQ